MRSLLFAWCDSGWNASGTPMWLYVRFVPSATMMYDATRVTLA